jgi:shikimate kinase
MAVRCVGPPATGSSTPTPDSGPGPLSPKASAIVAPTVRSNVVAGGLGFVVMSGLPGSGKSTLAGQLANVLNLEVLDKDDVLETGFFLGHDVTDADLRQRLSRSADDALRARAEALTSAILVSHWRREGLSTTAGTPTSWLAELPQIVEVYCDCPPDIAIERFRSRTRHPGHLDAERTRDQLVSQFDALASCGPLGIGRLVVVDTSEAVDLPVVERRVRGQQNESAVDAVVRRAASSSGRGGSQAGAQ